jgi:hypothetical protein
MPDTGRADEPRSGIASLRDDVAAAANIAARKEEMPDPLQVSRPPAQ